MSSRLSPPADDPTIVILRWIAIVLMVLTGLRFCVDEATKLLPLVVQVSSLMS